MLNPLGALGGGVKKSIEALLILSQHPYPIPTGDNTIDNQRIMDQISVSGAEMGWGPEGEA